MVCSVHISEFCILQDFTQECNIGRELAGDLPLLLPRPTPSWIMTALPRTHVDQSAYSQFIYTSETFILWPPLRAAAWAAQRKMEPGKRCMYILEAALRPFGNFKVSGIWRADNNWGGGFLMCQVGWAGCYFSEVPYLGVLWETWWVKGTAAIV